MGIPAKLINFPGTAENINALIKGDAQVGLFYLDDIAALLKAGEFRLLMIFAEKSGYAGVPSVYELGYPDLAESIRYQRYLVGPPAFPPKLPKLSARPSSKCWQKRKSSPGETGCTSPFCLSTAKRRPKLPGR
jgi:hypothetical protein